MKSHSAVLWALVVTAILAAVPDPIRAQEALERELEAIRKEIQALRHETEEQGKMLRTLYDFVDGEIGIEDRKKEAQREETLLLPPVARISDGSLTPQASANPVASEIAAITGDGSVRIYDMNGSFQEELRRRGHFLSAISYSPDGERLLAGTKAGALLVWDFAAGEWTVIAERVADTVGRVAWLGGTDKVVWGRYVKYYGDQGVKLNRDTPSGGVLVRATGETAWTFLSFIRDDFHSLSASLDGQKLAILEIPDEPRGAFILDGATGQVEATLFHSKRASGPLSVCIAPDNRTVAVGYAPYDIILWDAEEEKVLRFLEGHSNWVVSLAFSSDGRLLISGAGDSTARIWSVDEGKEVGRIRFPGMSTYVKSVGFSPDGETAFAAAGEELVIVTTPHAAQSRP